MPDNNHDSPLLVSVFMITYNQEQFVAQAIESILMQRINFNIEIVVGEDCSTDNTRNILLDYKQKHPAILKLLLHEKNIGASTNQIETMAACTGKYVAMCEGDDYWTDVNKLQKQVDFLEANPGYGFTCHKINRLLQESGELVPWPTEHFDEHSEGRDIMLDNVLEPYLIATVAVVYRNALINIETIRTLKYFKDIFLFALLLGKAKGICLKENMAVYRIHNSGIWSMQGKINNLISNALSWIYISKYFRMKFNTVNLTAYHESRACLFETVKEPVKYRNIIRLISFHLLFTFSNYSGLSKKRIFLKHYVKTFLM